MVAEEYPTWGERARSVLPDLLTFAGLGLGLGVAGLVPALAPDPAAYARARAGRHRARSPTSARRCCTRSARASSPSRDDGTVTVMSDSARELIGLDDDIEGRRVDDLDLDPAVHDLLADDAEIRDHVVVLGDRVLVVNRNPVLERGRRVGDGDHAARPHRAARPPERAERARVDHQHPARADPRVPQPAPHDLRPGAAGGVRRGVPPRRHAQPAPRGDLRRRARARRGPGRRRAADRQDQPGRRARGRPACSAPTATCRGWTRSRRPTSAPCWATSSTTRSTPRCPSAAAPSRWRCASTRDTVHLAVADTGPGVPADRVGEIFRRGWSSKESTASGRGVGLALVQVVCERRGGAVTVRPGDDGVGAVFEAALPGSGARGGGRMS